VLIALGLIGAVAALDVDAAKVDDYDDEGGFRPFGKRHD
jgi:hypothetical protein